MNQLMLTAVDCVAIAILTFGIYFPRHHRRDLVVAFLGVNIGVLAVSMTLGSSTVGPGSGSGCSVSCPSSGCVRTRSPSTKWRTTSRHWPSGCSPG